MRAITDRTVNVSRQRLLCTLRGNREKHAGEYAEAMDLWRQEIREKIENARQKALQEVTSRAEAAMKDPDSHVERDDFYFLDENVSVHAVRPRSFLSEYDSAILLFDHDVSDTVELSMAEFRCFIQDQWDWSQHFAQTMSLYKK